MRSSVISRRCNSSCLSTGVPNFSPASFKMVIKFFPVAIVAYVSMFKDPDLLRSSMNIFLAFSPSSVLHPSLLNVTRRMLMSISSPDDQRLNSCSSLGSMHLAGLNPSAVTFFMRILNYIKFVILLFLSKKASLI